MKNLVLLGAMVFATFFWYGFGDKRVQSIGSKTIYDMRPTNLTGADLTGANLEGVSLDGVILCNTTMPDGIINNTSCIN